MMRENSGVHEARGGVTLIFPTRVELLGDLWFLYDCLGTLNKLFQVKKRVIEANIHSKQSFLASRTCSLYAVTKD